MYIELAISVITGDGKIIGRYFLSFYLFGFNKPGRRKKIMRYFKQEKSTDAFPSIDFFSVTFSF